MPALLDHTDFDGLIPPVTLIQLTTENDDEVTLVSDSRVDAVIDKVSAEMYAEMWIPLASRYVQPDVPTGLTKTILKELTRFGMYLRRPTTVVNDSSAKNDPYKVWAERYYYWMGRPGWIGWLEKIGQGKGSIPGLDEITSAAYPGAVVVEDQVFDPPLVNG